MIFWVFFDKKYQTLIAYNFRTTGWIFKPFELYPLDLTLTLYPDPNLPKQAAAKAHWSLTCKEHFFKRTFFTYKEHFWTFIKNIFNILCVRLPKILQIYIFQLDNRNSAYLMNQVKFTNLPFPIIVFCSLWVLSANWLQQISYLVQKLEFSDKNHHF